ncbi:hypothetical protein [Micromonospora sp. WMMD1082]|uniref:hypothetical protein n=1 Tax=Micromonospora sp. WMMD1082 TaxID=3016104 RepID=UPI00241684CE|nr:hypothetical protein [Micromonospora sp. WMMD1082]MDG4792710.1 hypothetical protein [Micromonospora sp. WMMD1082]
MSRQPLLTRAAIIAGLGLLYATLAHFGVILPPAIADAVEPFALAVIPIALAYWGRGHVTPVADPRDADGSPLVPAVAPGDSADGGFGAGSFSPEADDLDDELTA